MADSTLALDANSWARTYSTSLIAKPVMGQRGFAPIPEHRIPLEFDKHALIVGASSFKTKPTWKLAFWLFMTLRVEGVGRVDYFKASVPLGLNLIIYPKVSTKYTLKAIIPDWHQEMNFTLWKYTGHQPNLLESVELQLQRIEYKIDAFNY